MKEIQPVSIWYNGTFIQATNYNMYSINDNLLNSATFYYQLLSNNNDKLAEGNLTMDGADYTNYSSSPDSNNFAFNWGASKLNLTII